MIFHYFSSPARILRFLLLAVWLLSIGLSAQAQLVISQVYGGGGNSGATLKNDFIEVFNSGNSSVSVAGWSVQYASSTGSSWQVTNLSGTVQPGQYYLIQESQGTGGTVNLPTPDATGAIAMSATAGKVALVNSTTALSGTCPTTNVQDLVGFGTANCSETSPTPALTNTTAALRAGAGCTDTNNNSSDFSTGAPNPRNTSSPLNVCGGSTALSITTATPLSGGVLNQPYSVTFTATGGTGTGYTFSFLSGTVPPGLQLVGATLSGNPTSTLGAPYVFTLQVEDSNGTTAQKQFSLSVTSPSCSVSNTIAQIQGSGTASPLAGQPVQTSGIVTGRKSNGFFIQMSGSGDGDPNTSDAVFVFTSSAPPAAAAVGNSVCVVGLVQEFIPSADPSSPSTTEIASPTVAFLATGRPLPTPVILTAADTNPAGGIFQLEKYEGMRVQINSLVATGPTGGTVDEANATSTSNGTFEGVIAGIPRPFREPGIQTPSPVPNPPCCIPVYDSNPEVLRVNTTALGGAALDVASGATVSNVVGPLDFTFRQFMIDTDPASPPTSSDVLSAIPVPTPTSTEFTVGNFNMERFFDTTNDPSTDDVALTSTAFANRLNKASLVIRNVMKLPDVLGVEEMENLSTLQAVAAKVNNDEVTAGHANPNYAAYLFEGNDIGGIDVGFLVKSTVSVSSVTQYGLNTTYTNPTTNQQDILNDRPPLVLVGSVAKSNTAAVPITVIVNHLRSLNGVDTDLRVRVKRQAQAEYLATLIQSFQTTNPQVNLVSVGDYNAYQFNDGYVDVMGTIMGTPTPADQVQLASNDLVNPDLMDLLETVPPDERYSYVFDGIAQELDHVLVNSNLHQLFSRYAVARNDADFPEVYRNDPNRPERISDHDLPVAYFTLPAATTDVTSSMKVTSTGYLYSRVTRLYSGKLTVQNVGATAIAGPIQLVLTGLPAGVTLANAIGSHNGAPYLTVAPGGLAPGESVVVNVTFSNPSNVIINFVPNEFSGTF